MELPSSYLNKFDQRPKKTSEPRSTWEEQLDLFAARLNPGRIKAGYKPYTHARLAKLLQTYGANDAGAAHAFYKKLDLEAANFGALFTTLTRPKKA